MRDRSTPLRPWGSCDIFLSPPLLRPQNLGPPAPSDDCLSSVCDLHVLHNDCLLSACAEPGQRDEHLFVPCERHRAEAFVNLACSTGGSSGLNARASIVHRHVIGLRPSRSS